MPSSSSEREGSLGIVYACGASTNGSIQVQEYLKGKKIKGIYGQEEETFGAIVDKWELVWKKEPQKVMDELKNIKIQQIAFGESHRLALTLDGEIYSWGTDTMTTSKVTQGPLGQVGITGTKARLIQKSPQNSLALEEDQDQEEDQKESERRFLTPKRIHTSRRQGELFFTCIAAGQNHSAAITKDGDLYTWGRNFEGQCGQNIRQRIACTPRYLDFFFQMKQRVQQIACGDTFTIVLVQKGAIYSFGQVYSSRHRRLFDVDSDCIDSTSHLHSSGRLLIEKSNQDDSVFTQITCGKSHTLALTSSGLLYSWGLNTYGQLGLASKEQINACVLPTQVEFNERLIKVFAGGNYSAALTLHGELYTWGNASHGKLAQQTIEHVLTPQKVKAFEKILISSVVCGTKTLYAFAPTFISSLYPKGGDLLCDCNGHGELRLKGSGFWASEDLTVRFVPSSSSTRTNTNTINGGGDGGGGHLLPRGSLGDFDAKTGEIVCKIPKFSFPGDFIVEVAMNGKHFTSNNHIFQVYKSPMIIQVSTRETRLEEEEQMTLHVRGSIPKTCENAPLIRFRPLKQEEQTKEFPITRGRVMSIKTTTRTAAHFLDSEKPQESQESSLQEEQEQEQQQEQELEEEEEHSLIEFQVPRFPSHWKEQDEYTTCIMEISYNEKDFTSIKVMPEDEHNNTTTMTMTAMEGHKQPFQLIVHDAQVDRIVPNSFLLTPGVPQKLCVHIKHLFDLQQSSVSIEYRHLDQTTGVLLGIAKAIVAIEVQNRAKTVAEAKDKQKKSLQVVLPPIETWEYKRKKSSSSTSTQWYTHLTFIEATLNVSLNGAKSVLPLGNQARLYGYVNRNLISLEPPCGPFNGETQVSLEGDFFKFDTQDAKVSLVFKSNQESTEVVVPAKCFNGRVTFTAPSFPFDSPPVLQTQGSTTDASDKTVITAVQSSPTTSSSYQREEVDVKVSLDGCHFAESSLRYVYYESIKMYELSPQEATPGTKIVVKTGSNTISTGRCCVRLRVLESGNTVDVPAEVNEASNTVAFVVPEIPINSKDYVYVSLSLNGQQFVDTITEGPPSEPAVSTSASSATKVGKQTGKSAPFEAPLALPLQLEHLDPPYLRFFYSKLL